MIFKEIKVEKETFKLDKKIPIILYFKMEYRDKIRTSFLSKKRELENIVVAYIYIERRNIVISRY